MAEPEYDLERYIDTMREIMERVFMTMRVKDQAYRGAWRSQGWMGNLARVMSKTARLKAMLWREESRTVAAGETVADTAEDLLALVLMMMINMDEKNTWGK